MPYITQRTAAWYDALAKVYDRHHAEALLAAMRRAGFTEVGLVWRMFAATVLVGFGNQTR